MRHGKKNNSLSRKAPHRKAMLSNMACSLIEHKRINTTVAKAKALRVYLEPLLTKSKTDSTHSRRIVFKYLRSKDATAELFREVAPKIADRPGGYLRIIRIGNRLGDNSEMCMIELVDFNEIMTKEPKEKKTRRSRRGGGANKTSATAEKSTDSTKEEKVEEPKTEESKAEKPKAEKKEEAPKKEAKKETPKAETKKETPKAKKESVKKEDSKADDKKSESKKEETKKEDKKDDNKEK